MALCFSTLTQKEFRLESVMNVCFLYLRFLVIQLFVLKKLYVKTAHFQRLWTSKSFLRTIYSGGWNSSLQFIQAASIPLISLTITSTAPAASLWWLRHACHGPSWQFPMFWMMHVWLLSVLSEAICIITWHIRLSYLPNPLQWCSNKPPGCF